MTEELTPSEKLEQLARFSEQARVMIRCARHAVGVSETPLRVKARNLIEHQLQKGGFTKRNPAGVYVDERFPRPLQSLVEAQRQRLKQKKEQEEAPAEEKIELRKEPKEDRFDFSVVIY